MPKAGNNPSLRVLFLEDSVDDALLCIRAIEKAQANFIVDVAQNLPEFRVQLDSQQYDIVLSDYALGGCTGSDAFKLMQQQGHDIPFILVTGALGEEKAVECIKNGMADYIRKDRLERLPIAMIRAIEEQHSREERKRAERSLRESEEQFRTLAEAIPAAIFIEQNDRCVYVNQTAEDLTGYKRDELLKMTFAQLLHHEGRGAVIEQLAKHVEVGPATSRFETVVLTERKAMRWLDVAAGTFNLNGQRAFLIAALDITDLKAARHTIQHLSDTATGLASYRRFAEVFDTEAKRTDRTSRPFALLLFSLGNFKEINNKYGYSVAGRAVGKFARIMRVCCRFHDLPARLGENKFAFILPETGAEGSMVLGRRIAARLAESSEVPELSCRLSGVVYPADGQTIDQLLSAAEQKLSLAQS